MAIFNGKFVTVLVLMVIAVAATKFLLSDAKPFESEAFEEDAPWMEEDEIESDPQEQNDGEECEAFSKRCKSNKDCKRSCNMKCIKYSWHGRYCGRNAYGLTPN